MKGIPQGERENERVRVFSKADEGLSSFAAKIWIGWAMNLYGIELRRQLTDIKEIRNLFAHTRLKIDFDTPAIADIFNSHDFVIKQFFQHNIDEESKELRSLHQRFIKGWPTWPTLDRYIMATDIIMGELVGIRKRRTPQQRLVRYLKRLSKILKRASPDKSK